MPPSARSAPPRRPEPAPYRTNDYAPVIVGITAWAIAAIVLLVKHHDMAARGQGWWLWVAVVGFALGFWGLVLVGLNHRAAARRASRSARSPDHR
ncbi:MAG TPA: DUF2530 domain-containing protein [Acidothermaceae bacterium]|nr:DUF2530 domain-containing protein [Acidothermaceae bacterium]